MRSSKYNSPNSLSSPIIGNTFPSCSIRVGNEPFLKTSVSSPSSSPKSVAMMRKVMRSKQRQRPYYGNQNRNTNNNNKCSNNNNNKRKNKFAISVDESNDTFSSKYKNNKNDKTTNYIEEDNDFTFKTEQKRVSNYKFNAKQYDQEKDSSVYINNDSNSSNNKKWTHDDDNKKRNRKFGWRRKMSHQRSHGNFDHQQKEQIPTSQEEQKQKQNQQQKEQSELLREFVKQIEDRKHNNNNIDTIAVSNELHKVETCQSNADTKESNSSDKRTKDKTEISNKETQQLENQRCNRQQDNQKGLYSWQNSNKSNTGKWRSYNTSALASMENDAWQEETHQYDNAEESNRRKYRPRQREQRKGKRLAFSSPAHNRYRPHINFNINNNSSSSNSKQKQRDDMDNTSTSISESSISKDNSENNETNNSDACKWEKKTKREQYSKHINSNNSKEKTTRSANATEKEVEHFVSKPNRNVNKFNYTHDHEKSGATRQQSRRWNRQEYRTPLRVMQNTNNDNEELRDMKELIEETNKEREEEFTHNERTNSTNTTNTRKNSKRYKVNNRREYLYNTEKYNNKKKNNYNKNNYNSRREEEKKYVESKVKSNSRSTFQLQNYQNKKYVDGQEINAKSEDKMKNENYCNSAEFELIVREFTSSMTEQEKETEHEHKVNALQTTKDQTDVSAEMNTGIDNIKKKSYNDNNTITSETKTAAVSTATVEAETEWLPPMPSVMTEKEIELSRRGLRVSAPEFRPHSAPNKNEVGVDYNYVDLAEFQQFPCMPAYPASNWQGAMMPPTELLYANYQEGQLDKTNSVTVDTNNVNDNENEEDQGWRVTSSSSIKESNVMQVEESIKPFISQRYRFKEQRHFPTASPTSITSDSQVMSNDGSPLYDFTSPISINDVSKLSEHSKWQQTGVRDYAHMDLPQTNVNENENKNTNSKAVCDVYEENDSTMPTLCVNASVSHHANQEQVLHNDHDNVRHHCVQMSDVVAKNEELMFDLLVDLPLTYTEAPQIHNICNEANNAHSQEVIETDGPVNIPEYVQSKMNDNSSINAVFTPTTTTTKATKVTKAGQSVGKDAHELHSLVSTESLFTPPPPPPPPEFSKQPITASCVTYTKSDVKRAEQEIHAASTVEEAAAANNNNIEYLYLNENEDEDEVEEAVWCGAASELQHLAQPCSFEPPQKLAPGGGYWSEEYQMNERSPSRAASAKAHKLRQPVLASPSLPAHISHTQLPTDASRQLSYTSYAPTSTSSERPHTSELTPSQYQSPTSMTTPQISLSLQNITLCNSQLEPYSASHNLSSLLLQQSTSAGSPSSIQQRAQKRYAWSMFSFNKDDEEDEQDIDAATDVNEWEVNSSAYEDSLDEAQVQWIEEQLRANENPDGYFGE